MSRDPFSHPKKTLRWAQENLSDFESEWMSFAQRGPYEKIVDDYSKIGFKIFKYRLTEPIPDRCEQCAQNALLYTRRAFDQTVTAACIALGVSPQGQRRDKRVKFNFPWRSKRSEVKGTLRSSVVPEELWDTILAEEPYQAGNGDLGGDDAIYAIQDAANHSHMVSLTLHPSVSEYIPHSYSSGWVQIPRLRWDTVNQEVVYAIVRYDAKFADDGSVNLEIVMDEPGRLGNTPAIGAIDLLLKKARSFNKNMEARVAEIIGQH